MFKGNSGAERQRAAGAVRDLALRNHQRPKLEGVRIATDLLARGFMFYRARCYVVPPIPMVPGLQLEALRIQLEELAERRKGGELSATEKMDILRAAEPILVELTTVLWLYCYPRNWVIRGIYRALRAGRWEWANPFHDATETELMDVLRFFSYSRTRSTVTLGVIPSPLTAAAGSGGGRST